MGRRARLAIFGAIVVSLSVLVPATAVAGDVEYDFSFAYGASTDYPVMGDWNGDGIDTPGVVRYGTWYLSNTFGGTGDYIFSYFSGYGPDIPVVGDWDGNGTDTPGVAYPVSLCNDCEFEPSQAPGTDWRPWSYHWSISNNFQGYVDRTFAYDIGDGKFVAGDWDADGVDTPGAYYNGTWHLSNIFGGIGDFIFSYGSTYDTPFVGRFGYNPAEFISDGPDTPGVWRAGVWYARTHYTPTSEAPPYVAPSPPVYDEPAEDYSQEAFQTQVLPVWARYAPEVRLHPSEQYWPARVITHFLQNAELKWGKSRLTAATLSDAEFGEIEPWRLGLGSAIRSYVFPGCSGYDHFNAWELTRPFESGRTSCLGSQEGFFLNLRDSARPGEPNNLGNVPVYYEFLSGRYVQYYFFYANDDADPGNLFDHEGDWERIAIDLDANNNPVRVAYYVHGCQPDRFYSWPNEVPRVDNTGDPLNPAATHPVIWSALGTHGSWHEVGDGSRDHCSTHLGIGRDQLSNNGRRWRTWHRMINANQAPWYGFGGGWGQRGVWTHSTGPLGPYPGKKTPPAGW